MEEFNHMYPETSAHSYALENANKKEATFSVKNQAKFVTQEFEKITELKLKLNFVKYFLENKELYLTQNSCIKLCCYDSIEFLENRGKKSIECNFVDLDGINKSKGH